jgi:hypothetical protein
MAASEQMDRIGLDPIQVPVELVDGTGVSMGEFDDSRVLYPATIFHGSSRKEFDDFTTDSILPIYVVVDSS